MKQIESLNIWKSSKKITDIQEPSYVFFLKEGSYKFYIMFLDKNNVDCWWCDSARRQIDFADLYEEVSEVMKEELLLNVNLLT